MTDILTAQAMRNAERAYMDTGVPSIALMERAGTALCDFLLSKLGGGKTCVFTCGTGGNGGDGYAAARLFSQKGGRAIALALGAPNTPDARENCERARECAFACIDMSALDELPRPDAWADCVFGIGLTRAPDAQAAKLFERIQRDRAAGALVVSCDIPSGLNADTGEALGACVSADATISFHAPKRGHYLGAGMDVCGELIIADIGISSSPAKEGAIKLIRREDVKRALPVRARTAHKHDFGHLLIIAGSRGMAGAACLCAQAALKSGVGLVTVACPASILNIVQTLAPCAMAYPLEEADGAISPAARAALDKLIQGKSAIACGSGLSARADAGYIEIALKCGLPAVLDADALNIIARCNLHSLLNARHVITPHMGEAKRLLGGESAPAFDTAARLRGLGANVLLKGAATLIYTDDIYLSASGTVGMAKGGSGDALTGILGALLAQGVSTNTAPWLASEIHGRAGEIARDNVGDIAMSPSDTINALGDAFRYYARA